MGKIKGIKAVIFDCDGVLFDSKQANINFYNSIRKHFGLPPMDKDEEDYVHIHTAKESVSYIFRNYPHLIEEAQRFREKMDYTPFIKYMKMEKGLKELLERLKKEGFGLAIATNRSNTIGPVLDYFDLRRFFNIVISLNINNFESINIVYGYKTGDLVLKHMSYYLRTISKNVYYLGNDQFAILLMIQVVYFILRKKAL